MADINQLLSQLSDRTQGNYNAAQPNIGQGLGEMLTKLADVLDASQKKQQADEEHKMAMKTHLAQIANLGVDTSVKQNREDYLKAKPSANATDARNLILKRLGLPTNTGPVADASQAFQPTAPQTNQDMASSQPELDRLFGLKQAEEQKTADRQARTDIANARNAVALNGIKERASAHVQELANKKGQDREALLHKWANEEYDNWLNTEKASMGVFGLINAEQRAEFDKRAAEMKDKIYRQVSDGASHFAEGTPIGPSSPGAPVHVNAAGDMAVLVNGKWVVTPNPNKPQTNQLNQQPTAPQPNQSFDPFRK